MPFLTSLATSFCVNLIFKGPSKIIKKIKEPEYIKYLKFMNPPFVMAFKSTCNTLLAEGIYDGDCRILLDKLSLLDDTALGIHFSDNTLPIEQFLEIDCLQLLTTKLKTFATISELSNIDESFYIDWLNKFKEAYKYSFKVMVQCDDYSFRAFVISALEISYEEYSLFKQTLLSELSEIKDELSILNKKTDISHQFLSDITSKIDTLTANSALISDNQKTSQITDEALSEIKLLIEKKHYNACIELINKKFKTKNIEYSGDLRFEFYHNKGICYFRMGSFEDAIIEFEKAFKYEKETDRALSNICKCFVNLGKPKKIKDYIKKFKNKTSPLYKEAFFYKIFYAEENDKEANEYLEANKIDIEEYNLLKYRVLSSQLAKYSEIIPYLEKYIEENNENLQAKLELARMKYSEIFENNRILFTFGVIFEDKIDILPVINESLDFEKVDSLIDLIEKLLDLDFSLSEGLALKIMLSILYSQKKDLSVAEKYISELKVNLPRLKDNFNRNNACMLLFLLKCFKEAYELFKEYLLEHETSFGIYAILNFALAQYEECLSVIKEKEINTLDLIKVIAMNKTQKWETLSTYFKETFDDYELNIKILILDFFYEKMDYSYCDEKYEELARSIIQNKLYVHEDAILEFANKLKFFKKEKLAEALLDYFWNTFPVESSFKIGMSCARKFFNANKISDCLDILYKLDEFRPNHPDIIELYVYIDLYNSSYKSVIKRYEEGFQNENLLYYVAIAYIQEKEYKKSEEVIEKLKYIDNQKVSYYISKIDIYRQTENFDVLLPLFKEAYNQCPDSKEIKQKIFFNIMSLPDGISSAETGELYRKLLDELDKLNVIKMFNVSSDDNVIENFQKIMEEVAPLKNENKKNELLSDFYKEYLDFKYPIQILYPFISLSRIEFFAEILQNPFAQISLNIGLPANSPENIHKNIRILLDVESLLLLKELDIDLKVKEHLNLCISNFTKQEIEKHLATQKSSIKSEGLLGRTKDGGLIFTYKNADYKKYDEFLKSVIVNYSVIEFDSSSKKGLNLIKANESFTETNILKDAIIGVQNDDILVCIDGVLSDVFKEFGVQITSTLQIIDYLYNNSLITYKEYVLIKAKLCGLNCKFISICAEDLYTALCLSFNYFIDILNSFNHKRFFKDSVTAVFADFIFKINSDTKLRADVKYRAINEIIIFINKICITQNDIDNFLIQIIPFYCELDNFVMFVLGNAIYKTLGYQQFLNFYITLINVFVQNIEQPKIADNIELYLEKLVLSSPETCRDKIYKYIRTKHNYLLDNSTESNVEISQE